MKKFEAWESLNGGCWEQDEFSEPVEADNESEALEIYLDSIEENLRGDNARRIFDPCPGCATFDYETEEGEPTTRLLIMMHEVEDDEE